MKETLKVPPPPVDALVESAERSLRYRYRAFLAITALLVIAVIVHFATYGSLCSRWALASTGWIVGLGVPWLGWHLRIPYAARIAAPILQLTGFALNGQDPRGDLWMLAELPLLFFLGGWGVDLCLRQKERVGSVIGRGLFSALWLLFCRQSFESALSTPEMWFDLLGLLCGIAAVWMPRGKLIPLRLRIDPAAEEIVGRGLRSAGGWLLSRAGIAVLILLPSVIYLDLLDLPPILRAEWEKNAPVADEKADAATEISILFWKREARALTAEDFEKMEVYVSFPEETEEIVAAIRTLRHDPRDAAALENFKAINAVRLTELAELRKYLRKTPVFYLDRTGSGDDRVTSGFFSAPGKKWMRWREVTILTLSDIDAQEARVRRSTLIILAGGVLTLLLLGGPSGGLPAAWWIAIFLAGTHIGWGDESLDLVIDRIRFTIWRDYANDQAGATLFELHTLLLFFVRSAEWLTENRIAQAGIWVSLCWPVRPGPLIRSRLDRLWLQTGKIALVATILYSLRLTFRLLGTGVAVHWTFVWLVIFPPLLVGAGIWMRRRTGRGSAGIGVIFPNLGRAAVIAFLLRGWVPLLTNLEAQGNLSPDFARWIGPAAVILAIAAAVILIVALERGTFLSPPHVDGQLWLIGAAAIPFIESVVGDPVSGLIEDSNLFLGSTVSWLAFAASLWVIGPIFSFLGDLVSQWKAKGLDRIAEFDTALVAMARSTPEAVPTNAAALCEELFDDLEIDCPQLWRHLGEGNFRRTVPASGGESFKLVSCALADALGGVDRSLRLEEMRLEWRWAAFHSELDRWFAEGGDLLLVPASHEGELLGVFSAPDVPANRFLLRPAVSSALGSALAAAMLGSSPAFMSPPPGEGIVEGSRVPV